MFASTEENGFQEAWRKSNRSESRLLVDPPPSPRPNIIYDQNLKLHQKKKDSPRPLPPRSGRARPDVFARPIVYNRRSWITAAIGGISSGIVRYSVSYDTPRHESPIFVRPRAIEFYFAFNRESRETRTPVYVGIARAASSERDSPFRRYATIHGIVCRLEDRFQARPNAPGP